MPAAQQSPRVRRVRVVLADDAPDFRALLRRRLEQDGRFTVVGEAGNGERAVELTREHEPDVLVIDLTMPVMDGLEAIRELRDSVDGVKYVVLTAHEPDVAAAAALEEGAFCYLTKSTATEKLLTVLAPLAPPEFE